MGYIDACVHPVVPRADQINDYLAKPFRDEIISPPLSSSYRNPHGHYVDVSILASGALPGSDPELMSRHVTSDGDFVILLPLGRGQPADPRAAAEVRAGTNRWLAETWLGEYNDHGRYRGSILVSPRSPAEAVREIERWADHPYFVQVAVPLESDRTYGDQLYFEIWEAAAAHGLPVAIHSDHGSGVLRPPTIHGYPTSYLELYTQVSLYGTAHLASLVAHGVFDRLESLVFVFADGGFDFVQTIFWRFDKDWRAARSEVPWVSRSPSDYLMQHARFVLHQADGSADPDEFAAFVMDNRLDRLLLFGSNYPHWDHVFPGTAEGRIPLALRAAIMGGNARELYGLPSAPAPV